MYDVMDKSRYSLLKAIICIDLEKIEKLDVHKGRIPTVEMHFYKRDDDELEKDPELSPFKHQIQLSFTGDMERQRFIDQVWGFYEDNYD